MVRRCIVHIGTEKTGTTSLQAALSLNRAALNAHGVRYPVSLGDPAHTHLALAASDPSANDVDLRKRVAGAFEDIVAFRTRLAADFAAEVTAHRSAACWIISSEHLQSRLSSTVHVGRVRDFLVRHFDEVRVILHLRPQVDMALSLAATVTRVGRIVTRGFFEDVDPSYPYYDYLGHYRRWTDAFGAENLICVAYRREPDLWARVLGMAGASLPPRTVVPRLNAALDVRVMATVNAMIRNGYSGRPSNMALDAIPVNDPLRLDRAFARAIQSRFTADNARLIALSPTLAENDLTPDWQRYPETGNLDLLETETVADPALQRLILGEDAADGSGTEG